MKANEAILNLTSQEQNSLFQILANISEKSTTVSFSNNCIRIYGESGYIYVLKKQGNVFVESYRTRNRSTKNSANKCRTYKTKRGKIKSNIIRIILGSTMVITAATLIFKNNHSDHNKSPIAVSTQLETLEVNNEMPSLEIQEDQKIILTTTAYPKETVEEISMSEIEEDTLEIDFEINQSSRFKKRIETDQLYGEIIRKDEKRWGIAKGLLSALITQERHDSIPNNPGQLTRMICGEKIILPIIEKSEQDIAEKKEVDKIYIIREEPKRENYNNEKSYYEQLEIYQTQLKKSKELQQEGYEIISFPELLDEKNIEQNIRISAAFLTYYNYKLNDPMLSTYAYNAGLTRAKNVDNIYDVLNGSISSENTDKLYLTHVYRFLKKEEAQNLQFIMKPFPSNFNTMSYDERVFYMNEEIKNTPLNITNISLINFREYTNEEEIGSNIRR